MQVSYYILIIFILVFGIIGNKIDLIDKQQVDEEEAKDYAEDYGAFYLKVSALSNNGLEDIFQKIGEKFLSGGKKDNENSESEGEDKFVDE